jgi:hypothetical protein
MIRKGGGHYDFALMPEMNHNSSGLTERFLSESIQ